MVVTVRKTLIFLCLVVCSVASEPEPATPTDDTDKVLIEHIHQEKECERRSKNNDVLHVHYTGTLVDGKQFDSTKDSDPMIFRLGRGRVIKGWDEGMLDMCPGDKRRLTVPPSKAYGEDSGDDAIPPNATLIFEVELLKIADEGAEADNDQADGSTDEFFNILDTDKDEIVTKEEFAKFIRESAEADPEVGGDAAKSAGGTDVMIDRIFAQEDKNKDGVITRDELDKEGDEDLETGSEPEPAIEDEKKTKKADKEKDKDKKDKKKEESDESGKDEGGKKSKKDSKKVKEEL